MENFSWHRLDNSAKIYPLALNKNTQNLFRISADMTDTVNPEVLSAALTSTIKRYPSFNVSLKKGLFWHYLEQLNGKPDIYEDSDIIIKEISSIGTCGYSFRVSYYEKRISIDCFHALCDGNGCFEFVKTLLFEYLSLLGFDIDPQERIKLANSPVLKEEIDDSFLRYAQNTKLLQLKGVGELRGTSAFTLNDFRFEYAGSGVIQGTFSSSELLKLSHENNATVTAYLGAVLAYSIYKTKRLQPLGNFPIVLFIPINLRKLFPSKTLLNFSLFSRCKIDINGELAFSDILERTKEALARDTNKDILQNKINVTAKTQKIFIFRVLPLFIKQGIFKVSQLFFGKNKKTLTFTNMGVLSLPDGMKCHINHFSVVASTSKTAPSTVSVCTALDKTTITFTRKIIDTEIEKFFFRYLSNEGLDITLTSNYWEV
ncbi:MAG: hypothetical protein RR033_05535 [Clostridia bacterium]